ncbi:hypothetical protein C3L33_12597, partial [Rhododendron williamsianum]
MVKFSKELEAQLIPEWKEAFVNYWQLKKHVKKIKLAQKPKQVQKPTSISAYPFLTPFAPSLVESPITSVMPDRIQRLSRFALYAMYFAVSFKLSVMANKVKGEDDGGEQVYETELVQLFSEEDEVKQFFESLDEELNKVNQFYKTREAEFLKRGEELNKQLQTLNERKQILSDRRRKSLSIENEEGEPDRAISTVTSMLWEDVLKNPKKELSPGSDFINRKKNQCAEKMIRGAFVELYRGLGLSLNMVAFTKILKKFDKHVCSAKLALVHVRVQSVPVEELKDQLQLHIRVPTLHCPQIQRRFPHLHFPHDRGGRGHGDTPRAALQWLLASTSRCHSWNPPSDVHHTAHLPTECLLSSDSVLFPPGNAKHSLLSILQDSTAKCARRWYDESDTIHLANMGKYVSAMVAAGARLTYAQQTESKLWMAIVLVTSLVATMYQLYWDFVKDWGLLNPKSKNPWLRDDLIVKNKSIYYVSIAFNFVLRVAWVETVMRFNTGQFESRLLEFFLASLEVIRRGHWNFYRLENEHLTNVGKFRAVMAVPLPFRDTDSD